MKQLIAYFGDVRYELSKVTWPKKEEVIRLTLVVFLISGFVGIFVGAIDFAFTKLLGIIVAI